MPIVIKELFPSDPISEAIEKINFNFDQLLLAGGGPPGPIGPGGPPGPIGPQGTRGDHWFTGATYGGLTADHDGSSPLQVQDNFIDPNGDVWNYFDIMGSTGWTFSGINLRGPAGTGGATGGSLEWDLFLGQTGNVISSSHYGPVPGPTTIDNDNLNFIAPLGPTKNGLLLGDPDWFYNSVLNWNSVLQFAGGGIGPAFQESTPRLTVIQREVDQFGVNGIQIGAYGLTGATYSTPNPLYTLLAAPTGSTVNALDFFSVGIGVYGSYNREIVRNPYFTHSATIKTLTRDITIEAGEPTYGGSNTIRLKSNNFVTQNYSGNSWISMGYRLNPTIPGGTSKSANVIEINTSKTSQSATSYVSMQGTTGLNQGPVIIGRSNDLTYTYEAPASLIISRPSVNTNTTGSSILFVDVEQQINSSDYVGRILHVQNPTRAADIQKGIVLYSNSISIASSSSSAFSEHQGRFPFHVNQLGANLSPTNWGWPSQPIGWSTVASGGFGGWLAGFDKFDYRTSVSPLTQTTARGFGIGYVKNNNGSVESKEIVLQTYFTGNVQASSDPGGTRKMSPPIFNSPSGLFSTDLRESPHLFIQLGSQLNAGNLAIGLGPSGGNRNPWSKLTVNGTVRVGIAEDTNTSLNPGIFEFDRANAMAPGGLLVGGRIIRGFIQGATQGTYYSTSGLTGGQVLMMIEGTTGSSSGSTGIGISSLGWIMGDYFLARGGSGPTAAAYSLSDGRSGMRPGSSAGDAYLVASNAFNFAGTVPGTTASEILRFSTKGDFGSIFAVPGQQARGRNAESVRYILTSELEDLAVFKYYKIGTAPVIAYKEYSIPTDKSVIVLNLFSPADSFSNITSKPTVVGPASGATKNSGTYGLNGRGPGGNIPTNGLDFQLFTLDPGEYDGQDLTLIVNDVLNPNDPFNASGMSNSFVLSPSKSIGSINFVTGYGSPTVAKDYIIMNKEVVLSPSSIAPNNLSSGNTMPSVFGVPYCPSPYFGPVSTYHGQHWTTIGAPFPYPSGASSLDRTEIDWAYISEVLLNNPNQRYTYSGQWSIANGWKTIKFKWVQISDAGAAPKTLDSYAWVEISRESLAAPKNVIYQSTGTTPIPFVGGGK